MLDAITQVLVKCNSERPDNALAFVLDNLTEKYVPLKAKLQEAHEEIDRLKAELSALKVCDESKQQEQQQQQQQPPPPAKPQDKRGDDAEEKKIDTAAAPQTNGVVEGAAAAGAAGEARPLNGF